jgi:uncharacterized RDD family membrane protein YckC
MSEKTTDGPGETGRPLVPGTASWPHRLLALLLDWLASYAVAFFILRNVNDQGFGLLTLLIFLLESAFGLAVAGASFGQLLARIRVRRLDGRPLSLFAALARQLLVCLVIPPLIFRGDGRGVHDMVLDTAAYPLVGKS